jgi:hypothetical protein
VKLQRDKSSRLDLITHEYAARGDFLDFARRVVKSAALGL